MLGNYRVVFRAPGSVAFCTAGFIMRMSIGLYPIGLVLLISLRSGHYAFGGALSAVYTAGSAIGNPVLGRLVDRYGQGRVLRPATAVHVIAAAIVVVLAQLDAPDWTLLTPALVIGLAYPSVGSLTRARWSQAFSSAEGSWQPESTVRATLTTAYSLESTLDEVIFVVGPPIVTVIATQVNPVIGIGLAGALVGFGGLWLAQQRATEPPAHPRPAKDERVSLLRRPGMLGLLIATVGAGAFFASAEITIVAYCGQHGDQSIAGLALSALALGSATSGLLYGARHWRLDLVPRFRIQALVFGGLPLLFLLVVSVPMLIAINFVVGACIAPTLITVYGLIERIVPASGLTEGFSWLTTALGIGYGVAAATAGRVADAYGASRGFLVPCAAALLTALAALAAYRALRAGAPASQPQSEPAR
jgi:predicted MFS family arabinose efflux permease